MRVAVATPSVSVVRFLLALLLFFLAHHREVLDDRRRNDEAKLGAVTQPGMDAKATAHLGDQLRANRQTETGWQRQRQESTKHTEK